MTIRRYAWLGPVTAVSIVCTATASHGTSWHFFDDAARLFVGSAPHALGPGGLHLFRSHPEFQFGPVAVVAATALHLLAGPHAALAAEALMVPLPLVVVWLLDDTGMRLGIRRRSSVAALLGGAALITSWTSVAVLTAHLDDALALVAAVAALNLISRKQPTPAAVALGVAAAAKPWAVVFVPLVLALPRRRTSAAAVALGIAAIGWVPFVLADHETIAALSHYTIQNSPVSALRALEIETRSTPPWDRAAQLLVGLAVVTAVVVRHPARWPGALLAGVGARLTLDPGTHHYYTAGLVLAGLAWDVLASPFDWPVASIAALLLMELPRAVLPSELAGTVRLATTLGAVALALVGPVARPARRPASAFLSGGGR